MIIFLFTPPPLNIKIIPPCPEEGGGGNSWKYLSQYYSVLNAFLIIYSTLIREQIFKAISLKTLIYEYILHFQK